MVSNEYCGTNPRKDDIVACRLAESHFTPNHTAICSDSTIQKSSNRIYCHRLRDLFLVQDCIALVVLNCHSRNENLTLRRAHLNHGPNPDDRQACRRGRSRAARSQIRQFSRHQVH